MVKALVIPPRAMVKAPVNSPRAPVNSPQNPESSGQFPNPTLPGPIPPVPPDPRPNSASQPQKPPDPPGSTPSTRPPTELRSIPPQLRSIHHRAPVEAPVIPPRSAAPTAGTAGLQTGTAGRRPADVVLPFAVMIRKKIATPQVSVAPCAAPRRSACRSEDRRSQDHAMGIGRGARFAACGHDAGRRPALRTRAMVNPHPRSRHSPSDAPGPERRLQPAQPAAGGRRHEPHPPGRGQARERRAERCPLRERTRVSAGAPSRPPACPPSG